MGCPMAIRVLIAFLAFAPWAVAQEKDEEKDWRKEAAEKTKLKPEQIKILGEQKILLLDEYYKRGLYTLPLRWDARLYHVRFIAQRLSNVLLEESIYRLERTNAGKFPAYLEATAKRLDEAAKDLPAKPELLAAAKIGRRSSWAQPSV